MGASGVKKKTQKPKPSRGPTSGGATGERRSGPSSDKRRKLSRAPTTAEKDAAIKLVTESGMTPYAVTRKEGAPHSNINYAWLYNHTIGRKDNDGVKVITKVGAGRPREESNKELTEKVLEWSDRMFVEQNKPPSRASILTKAAEIDALLAERDGMDKRWPKGIAHNQWWNQLRADNPDWRHRMSEYLEAKREDAVTPAIAHDTATHAHILHIQQPHGSVALSSLIMLIIKNIIELHPATLVTLALLLAHSHVLPGPNSRARTQEMGVRHQVRQQGRALLT